MVISLLMSMFFLFYPCTEDVTHQKFQALHVGSNSISTLEQAQGPVFSSDAAVKTEASWLVNLTNASKAVAISVSSCCSNFSFSLYFSLLFCAGCDGPHRSVAKRSYHSPKVRGGGREELPHTQGQGPWPGGPTPRPRPGAGAGRTNPKSKEPWLRGHRRA